MTTGISVERLAGNPIDLVVIDRPPVNALPPSDWADLRDAVAASSADQDVRAVVIAGRADAFCAGADIRHLSSEAVREDGTTALDTVAEAANAVREARVPVIAAIAGPAHGGGLELALACDIRVAAEGATFAAAGVNMGLIASVGALIAAIGDTRARWMLLTGSRIDARRAADWGLVIAPDDAAEHPDVLDVALEMAQSIAAKPPLAVEATKRAATEYHRLPHAEHHRLVDSLFTDLAHTDDHAEALAAFLEKRSPRYSRK